MRSDGMEADCFRHESLGVVFQVRDSGLTVLLWQRAEPPFEGRWALPGGLVDAAERLGASASRHLAAKVDIPEIAHLEQLETRSDPARDPRERVLATAYLALVPPDARPRLPGCARARPVTPGRRPSPRSRAPAAGRTSSASPLAGLHAR